MHLVALILQQVPAKFGTSGELQSADKLAMWSHVAVRAAVLQCHGLLSDADAVTVCLGPLANVGGEVTCSCGHK